MHDNVNYNGPKEAAFGLRAPDEGSGTVAEYTSPAGTGQTKTEAWQIVD